MCRARKFSNILSSFNTPQYDCCDEQSHYCDGKKTQLKKFSMILKSLKIQVNDHQEYML